MSYIIRRKTLDFVIRAYLRGEEVTRDNIRIYTGIKTNQVNGVYWKEFKKWLESDSKGEKISFDEIEEKEELTEKENMIEEKEEEVFNEPSQAVIKKTLISKKSLFPDFNGYTVKIEDDNGVESTNEFEIVATSHTSKMIVVKEIKPILKDVIVNGAKISVDVRKLKTMLPDTLINGVKVSTLLIAATIA